tara:strand:- start:1179 stop:8945 length:7767 start_codon:yes stop_codon:yes gene_type:complete
MTTTYVLNRGQTTYSSSLGTYGNSQTKTSINPVIVNEGLSFSESTSLTYYEIRKDDSTHSIHDDAGSVFNRTLPTGTNKYDVLSNAQETPGYRLRLPSGTTFSPDTAYDYFVVIYSTEAFANTTDEIINLDNHKNKMHIAKITGQIRIDSTNDGIEFTPKINYDIAKGTKYAIYKGPHIVNDTEVVAIAYGLLGDGSGDGDRRYDIYATVNTPHFYFYDERLDTPKQLNYVSKYKLTRKHYESNSDRSELTTSVFLTQSMVGKIVQDKSPYTYNVEIIDSLLNADTTINSVGDVAQEVNATSFATYSNDYTFSSTNWSNCFRNILRSTTNRDAQNLKGPSRYINYVSSEEKTNIFPHLLDMNVFTTINRSGSYGEIRFADPNKILNKKIKDYDSLKVRNILFSEEFNNEADTNLPGLAYYLSSNVLQIRGLSSNQSLGYYAGEPNYLVNAASGTNVEVIRVNNYHYRITNVSDISSLTLDATTQLFSQDLTIGHYRHINESNWTVGGLQDTLISAEPYYRRKWSSITNNLLVEFNLNSNYTSTIELILKDREYSGNRIKLSSINEHRKLIVPNNIPNKLYQPSETLNYLNYFSGDFLVDKLVFNGSIEYMEDYIEDGQLMYLVSGRDKTHELIGPVINENYLHAQDYVYSSHSPIEKIILTDVKLTDTPIGSTTAIVNVTGSSGTWHNNKNKLYRSDGALIGVVKNLSDGVNLTFEEPTRIGYVKLTHGFIYTDALINSDSTNFIISGLGLTGSTTSAKNIKNSSDKGIIFTGGKNLSGVELIHSSATTGNYSLGYDINSVTAIGEDNPFLFRLANEKDSNDYFKQETVSALTNYDVMGINSSKNNNTVLTISPISPFILARLDGNSSDTTYENSSDIYFLNTQSLNEGGIINLVDSKTYVSDNGKKKPVIWKNSNDKYGSPIYRYFNFEKGGKGSISRYYMTGSSASYKLYSDVYNGHTGNASGHATAYRFKEGLLDTGINTIPNLKECADIFTIDSPLPINTRYFPPENRGPEPVLGSNFADYHFYDSSNPITFPLKSTLSQKETLDNGVYSWQGATSDGVGVITHTVGGYDYSFVLPRGNYFSGVLTGASDTNIDHMRDKFQLTSPSMTQYHIFAPCDIYTDSINNKNHIGYSTSNFTFSDFNIFLQAKPTLQQGLLEHEHYIGGGQKQNRTVGDYISTPILSGSITPQNMKRFSLGRLIEVGFDSYFNLLDVENPSFKSVKLLQEQNTQVDWQTSGKHHETRNHNTYQYRKIRLAEKTPIRVKATVSLDAEYITVDESEWFVDPDFSIIADGIVTAGKAANIPEYMDYLFNDKGHFLGIKLKGACSIIDSGINGGVGEVNTGALDSSLFRIIPTVVSGTQNGVAYIDVPVSGGSGTGMLLLINEDAPTTLGTSLVNTGGQDYVAGDIITVSKAELESQAAAAGGTDVVYSGDLVFRLPTDVIQLATLSNCNFPTLAGYDPLGIHAGNKGLEFNSHIRNLRTKLDYTAWGFNTHSNTSGHGNVLGAMTTMVVDEHIYALRFRSRDYAHDVSQSFNFKSIYVGEGQPQFSEYIPLTLYQITDNQPIALTNTGDNGITDNPIGVVYHELGTTNSGYNWFGWNDTSYDVGDNINYTFNNSNSYSLLTTIGPVLYTPFHFSCFNLRQANTGDSSAPHTGWPSLPRTRFTRYGVFNKPQFLRGTTNISTDGESYYRNDLSSVGAGKDSTVRTVMDEPTQYYSSNTYAIEVSSVSTFSIGDKMVIWNSDFTPRYIGEILSITGSVIYVDRLRTTVLIGDSITKLVEIEYNYYHPNRIIDMMGGKELPHYGACGDESQMATSTAGAGPTLTIGAGIGPFVSGHFVLLKNLGYKGTMTADYTAGSSVKAHSWSTSRYNTKAGIMGGSDQAASQIDVDTSPYPFAITQTLAFNLEGNDVGIKNNIGGHHYATAMNNNNQYGHYAFKPILRISTTHGGNTRETNTVVSSVVNDTRTITIDLAHDDTNFDNGYHAWLSFVPNLTNYYLVSNRPKSASTSYLPPFWPEYTPQDGTYNLQNLTNSNNISQTADEFTTPYHIHQIINHEVIWNADGTQKHVLTIDNAAEVSSSDANSYAADGEYKLMKFADTCMYDYTPKDIRLYQMTNQYTKMPEDKKLYGEIPHHNITKTSFVEDIDVVGNSNDATIQQGKVAEVTSGKSRHNEGFKSMYVILDPEPETSGYTLIRDIVDMVGIGTRYIPNTPSAYTVNDGNEKYSSVNTFISNTSTQDDKTFILSMSEMKEMVGLVSFGEQFNLTVPTNIELKAETCKIGTTYNIGTEVDNVINDLMESNNIVFTNTNSTEKYFIAPNLKGGDLYSSLLYVGRYKGLEPRVIGQSVSVKPINDSADITNITIREGESQVVISKRNTSTFDLYNEVIVYGSGYRAIKRNGSSIKSVGVKTLEETDLSLTSQKEVNDKASDLLKLHTAGTHQIELDLGIPDLEYLEVGKIVNVDYPSEHIPVGKYLILEINHKVGKALNIVLGYYSKNLEYRLAELITSGKQVNANLRGDNYDDFQNINELIADIKIKEIRIYINQITTGVSAGSQGLGLGTTLGLNTMLGFVQTAGTTSQLVYEEEL